MDKGSIDHIDFRYIIRTILARKKLILAYVIVLFCLGVTYAFLSENEYTADTIFVPTSERSGSRGGKWGSLASLAGISIGSASITADLSPFLYKKVVKSVPFKRLMMEAKVTLPGTKESVTYADYYESHYKPSALTTIKSYTIGLPGTILNLIRGKKENDNSTTELTEGALRKLSARERISFARLGGQINLRYDELEGYIQLSVVMNDPVMAAEIAHYAQGVLEDHIIEIRLARVNEELKFTEDLFEEKKGEYEIAMADLADFQDGNQSISSARGTSELQKLQSDFDLAFSVYSELARQLQQVRLQVKKDTPIFSVLEPVTIPHKASGPRKPLIVIISVMLAVLAAVTHIFGKEFIKNFKSSGTSESN